MVKKVDQLSGVQGPVSLDCLVEYPGRAGIGRIGAEDGRQVRVDYFESVALPIAESVWVPVAECCPVALLLQTRVFWSDEITGAWRAGRVVGGDKSGYFVRPPNSEIDYLVQEADIRVRWDRPVSSPVDVLLAGANESPYFRDARLPMLRSLIAQRAACAGTSALLSSAVEIFPHQIQAALAVLSDPVQRYLLAAEVGLGKTIEAGFVIRQTLLDHPKSRIAVLVPDSLRRQWQAELLTKFFIDDFPLATIKIIAHETPERWAVYHGYDLVVVDEAHRLVQVDGPEESPYRELSALVHSSPRLLLLSATPATRRLNTHLGLLHLLDRDLYRWEDVASFREKFDQRRLLANHLYALTADEGFEFLLPSVIKDIISLAPHDRRLAELAGAVKAYLSELGELEDEARRPELATEVEAMRAHISETYRLHRRVIRHRRTRVLAVTDDLENMPFEVRGRNKPQKVLVASDQLQAAQDALFDWHARVSDWLRDNDATSSMVEYGQVLAVLVSRAGGVPTDLIDAFHWRFEDDRSAADRAGLTAEERDLLSRPDVVPAERRILEALVQACEDSGIGNLADALQPLFKERTVVFCGPGSLCGVLKDELARGSGDLPIFEHSIRAGAKASERAVERWRRHGGVLVADATGEDGLNLQHADSVVHCRFPWSPNRLEQTLGRVDRYSGALPSNLLGPAKQYFLSGTDSDLSFSDAWFALLDRGFGIFTDSVSALQDAIDASLPAVWQAALDNGPHGLMEEASGVTELLAQERKEIDGMDMLESVHESPSQTRDVAVSIGTFETGGWKSFEAALPGYAGDAEGGLRFFVRRSGTQYQQTVEFERGRVAPLMPPRMFAVAGTSLTPAQMKGVFNRTAALRRPGTRLFRSGQPFVDLLTSVIAIDDRGQASALWRRTPRRLAEPEVYLCLDYVVEAETADALALVDGMTDAENALRRQADRLFEPFLRRLWLSPDGKAVVDTPLLNVLNRPYNKAAGDINLNSDRAGALFELFGGQQQYGRSVRALEEVGRSELERVSDIAKRCAEAQRQAGRAMAIARAQAEARHGAGRFVGDADSYLTDLRITEALVDGLSHPRISIAAITCLVLGDYSEELRGT